ncbi:MULTISPECIES: HD domain-containing protein [Providencia]|uniref:HD domain-containing protein n=1 Tax=Providencia TaxID=586 RepID=UPI0023498787|nr:HD domain-containing protein [Providencia sp. PROV089]
MKKMESNKDLIKNALTLATEAHKGQKRKYTGEDYINHPIEVSKIIALLPNSTDEMVAAALLHDVVEDTEVTIETIVENFGFQVAYLVRGLTNIKFECKTKFNRNSRYGMNAAKLFFLNDYEIYTVKIADIINNISNVLECDRSFAIPYLAEKKYLFDSILSKNCDPTIAKQFDDLFVSLYDELDSNEQNMFNLHYGTKERAALYEIGRRNYSITKERVTVKRTVEQLQPNDVLFVLNGWYRVRYLDFHGFSINVQLQREEDQLSYYYDSTCMHISVNKTLNALFDVEVKNG